MSVNSQFHQVSVLRISVAFLLIVSVWMGSAVASSDFGSASSSRESRVDLSAETLPVHFVGDSLKDLAYALIGMERSSSKGEYETTNEYEMRLNKAAGSPLIDGATVNDTFAFCSKFQTSYDADSRRLAVSIVVQPVYEGREFPQIMVQKEDRSRVSILASDLDIRRDEGPSTWKNQYGASIDATKVVFYYFGLAFPSKSLPITQAAPFSKLAYHLDDISVSEAKNIRDDLRGVFFFKLRKPYMSIGTRHFNPTISDPVQTEENYWNVNGHLAEFWVFKYSTGQVFRKVRLSDAR